MNYNSALETFVDFVEFTNSDPCVWVVYPPGAAGDLLSSVLLKHYCNPAAEFYGITDNGQVIFRDSNYKHFNSIGHKIENSIVDVVNKHLNNKNRNYSVTDQIFFSNHAYKLEKINDILTHFPKSKVIRIIPKNIFEKNVINWLAKYKNSNIELSFSDMKSLVYNYDKILDPRVLTIYFGDIINEIKFEQTYDKIINHLDLPYKLIRHDFIKFWLLKQHPTIQTELKKL